jgi:hypothetical protein
MEMIRVKAMLLILDNGRLLVSPGYDEVKGEKFYRLLGGNVKFSEPAATAIRREIL